MTNGTTGSKQIISDAGFSDPSWDVGCQVRGSNFGEICLGAPNQECVLGTLEATFSNGLDYAFVNLFFNPGPTVSFQAESGQTYYVKIAEARVYNCSGGFCTYTWTIEIVDASNTVVASATKTMSYNQNSWPTLYLVGLGFGGRCKMGAYDYISITFVADSDKYDASRSTLPPDVGVLIYYQGIPTVIGDIGELRVIGTSDVGKEASIRAEWPKNSSGINYKCDVQLNAKLRIIQNDFFNKYDIFEEAKLYIYLGGSEYCEVDLLSIDTSKGAVVLGNAVLPSGSYSDGAYELKVKAKEIPQNEQFVVKCNMVLWYESGYAHLCD